MAAASPFLDRIDDVRGKAPLSTGAAQDVDIRKSTDFRKTAVAAPAPEPTAPSAVNSCTLGKPPAQTAPGAVNSRVFCKPPAQPQAQTSPSAVNSRVFDKPPAADAAGEDVGHPPDAPFLSRIDSVMASTSTNKRLPNDASAYAIQPQPVQKIHRQRPQSHMSSQGSSQKVRQKSIQTTITSMAAAKPAGFQPRLSSPHGGGGGGGGGGNHSVWLLLPRQTKSLASNCYRVRAKTTVP
jgi:hypothetical protein